jgi:hypothetical protein
MGDTAQVIDSDRKEPEKKPRSHCLRTGLLLLSSAAFGGLAVALWNRRTLARMQNESQESAPEPLPPDDEAIY